jgi:predicted GNAT family N-acyltransferase
MTITVKRLDSQHEFEAIKIIRSLVFIEEQGISPDLEIDEFDDSAVHAVAYFSDDIVGTGRLIIDNDTEARIGRMAVESSRRGNGIGSAILGFLENEALKLGTKIVILHAQNYVKEFYVNSGYHEHGDTFMEAGILHIEMRKAI